MTNRSITKGLITKLKNRIINSLHEADIERLIKIAKILNIKVSPELKKLEERRERNPD